MLSDRRQFLLHSAKLLGIAAALSSSGSPRRITMLTRRIPRSGEELPAVGLGTWQTFDPPALTADALTQLRDTLQVFYDAGGRVVDSSPMYGKSERVVGDLTTELGLNSSLFLATKVWTSGERAGVSQMDESMTLLRRKRLDLMQVHNLVDWRTHLRTLRRWKDEGRVRYIGVTHYERSAFDQLERIVRQERLDFVQLPYSVGLRDAERRLIPAAAESETAVIVNRPFEGGSLFRDILRKPLPERVRSYAASWPQAFLKFILANPWVTCVIPGTGNPRHMRDNADAGSGRLPDAREREELVRLIA